MANVPGQDKVKWGRQQALPWHAVNKLLSQIEIDGSPL